MNTVVNARVNECSGLSACTAYDLVSINGSFPTFVTNSTEPLEFLPSIFHAEHEERRLRKISIHDDCLIGRYLAFIYHLEYCTVISSPIPIIASFLASFFILNQCEMLPAEKLATCVAAKK
jgi:hypothetical protein